MGQRWQEMALLPVDRRRQGKNALADGLDVKNRGHGVNFPVLLKRVTILLKTRIFLEGFPHQIMSRFSTGHRRQSV